jgi:hypothetical protein
MVIITIPCTGLFQGEDGLTDPWGGAGSRPAPAYPLGSSAADDLTDVLYGYERKHALLQGRPPHGAHGAGYTRADLESLASVSSRSQVAIAEAFERERVWRESYGDRTVPGLMPCRHPGPTGPTAGGDQRLAPHVQEGITSHLPAPDGPGGSPHCVDDFLR